MFLIQSCRATDVSSMSRLFRQRYLSRIRRDFTTVGDAFAPSPPSVATIGRRCRSVSATLIKTNLWLTLKFSLNSQLNRFVFGEMYEDLILYTIMYIYVYISYCMINWFALWYQKRENKKLFHLLNVVESIVPWMFHICLLHLRVSYVLQT